MQEIKFLFMLLSPEAAAAGVTHLATTRKALRPRNFFTSPAGGGRCPKGGRGWFEVKNADLEI